MADELRDYSKDKFLNRPIKPETHKAIKDAYDTQYRPTPGQNDMKMMARGFDAGKVRGAGPVVKNLVDKVLRLEQERNNNGEVY